MNFKGYEIYFSINPEISFSSVEHERLVKMEIETMLKHLIYDVGFVPRLHDVLNVENMTDIVVEDVHFTNRDSSKRITFYLNS